MTQVPAPDPLRAAIDLTAAALALVTPEERASWLFARCWMLATRFEPHGRDRADLAEALRDFDALPPSIPGRAKLAAVLVVAQLRAGVLRESDEIQHAAALVEIADTDATPLPDWPMAAAAMRALALVNAGKEGEPGFNLRAALVEVERLAVVVGDTKPYVTMVDMARLGLSQLRAAAENDVSGHQQAAVDFAKYARQFGPESPLYDRGQILQALMAAHTAGLR